jgi:calcineurin-like phosphoesterase family protein
MSILYTADSHFDHANIIKYCKRPFASVETMNSMMACNLSDAAATGQRIIHAGDLSFNFQKYVRENGALWKKVDGIDHTIILGNHDDVEGHKKLAYLSHFALIVGTVKTWKLNAYSVLDLLDGVLTSVLVTHYPAGPALLPEGWVNVHGHIHNNAVAAPDNKESGWTLKSPVHFNAGVELHNYKPVSLQALADEHRRGYSNSRANSVEDGSEFGVDSGA